MVLAVHSVGVTGGPRARMRLKRVTLLRFTLFMERQMDDVYVNRSRLSSLKDASSAATKLLPSSSLRYSSKALIESISPAHHLFFLRANGGI